MAGCRIGRRPELSHDAALEMDRRLPSGFSRCCSTVQRVHYFIDLALFINSDNRFLTSRSYYRNMLALPWVAVETIQSKSCLNARSIFSKTWEQGVGRIVNPTVRIPFRPTIT